MTFSYDYIANILFNNGIGPDIMNKYYNDSDPTSASATITVYNILGIPLTSFSRSDANTKYCKWNGGNDTTGNGTWANPYKSILKGWNTLDATHYQVGIITDNNEEDNYFESWTRWLNNPAITNSIVRFFAIGKRTPIILSESTDSSPLDFFTGSPIIPTSIEFHNIWFNCYWWGNKASWITEENIKSRGGIMMQGISSAKLIFYLCGIINSGSYNNGIIFNIDYSIGRLENSESSNKK